MTEAGLNLMTDDNTWKECKQVSGPNSCLCFCSLLSPQGEIKGQASYHDPDHYHHGFNRENSEASHWEKHIEGGGRNGGCNVKASTTNDKNKRKSFTSLCLFYLRMWTKATCYRDAHMDSMCMHTHNGVQLMKRIKCQTNSLTLLWSSPINTNIPEDIKATKRRLASLIMHCVVAKEPPRSGRWAIKSLDLRCS